MRIDTSKKKRKKKRAIFRLIPTHSHDLRVFLSYLTSVMLLLADSVPTVDGLAYISLYMVMENGVLIFPCNISIPYTYIYMYIKLSKHIYSNYC